MKKTFLTLALLIGLCLNMGAQTEEYKQKFRELTEMGVSCVSPQNMKKVMSDTFKNMIGGMSKQMGGTDADVSTMQQMMDGIADEVIGPYFESGEFINDMVENLAPIYAKEFSIDDLNQIIAAYNTPEAKALVAKGGANMGNLSNVSSDLVQPIMAIAMGGEAPKVQKVDCPADYREIFDKYFQLSAGPAMDAIKDRMGKDESNPMIKKVRDYLTEAIPEMTLKAMYPAMTKDDLQSGIDLCSNPIVQRYIKSSVNISNDTAMKAIADKIQSRVKDYIKESYK